MLLYILQFFFTLSMEILAVLDLRLYRQHKRKEAVFLSGIIGIMGCIATKLYIDDNWLIIPDVMGLMVGTWIVMTYIPWED
jgi:hypothetical protein